MSVSVHGVSKFFGTNKVLDSVRLEVAAGSFTSLLGPSGCGKSTVLRLIAGLETPNSGRIEVGGRAVFDGRTLVPPRHRDIGMVFQDLALWPHMTVRQNVEFPLRTRGGADPHERHRRVEEVLERVGMATYIDRRPSELSGGQQQRVAFARAVVAEPRVLLMDESLSALDAALRRSLGDQLSALVRDFGIATVFVTHDQAEALRLSDEVVVMGEGTIRQVGSPTEVYRAPIDGFVADFVGTLNRVSHDAPGAHGVRGYRPESVRVDPAGELSARVDRCQFEFGNYRITASLDEDGPAWTLLHHAQLEEGSTIRLSADRHALIETAA